MKEIFKRIFLVLVILYVISPLDACPGPIDDLILILITYATHKKVPAITSKRESDHNNLYFEKK